MTTFGLSDTGFVPMALQDVRDAINAALQLAFGASIDVSDSSILGQIVGIVSEQIASTWSNTQIVYSAWDPDAATGAALDALCAITGTNRPQATSSQVTATLTGVPSTVVPLGSTAETASTSQQFSTLTSGTITLLTSWSATTYVAGNRVTKGGNAYQCTTGGTSSGGPSGTTSPQTDGGGVVWIYLGQGTGAIDVQAASVKTGPIVASAADLTQIVTPVNGWEGVYNVADATPGQNLYTDSQLRALRTAELASDGQATQDAITAKILQITGVTSCVTFMNNTDSTNAQGMPPHSVMAMVQTTWSPGAQDQPIYNALWQNVAAGIVTTAGNATAYTGTVVDSQGNNQSVTFARATATPIYIIIDVTVDAPLFPSTGSTTIQTAVAAWGNALGSGYNVVASRIAGQTFDALPAGAVLDVPTVYIGTSPSPASSTTVTIDSLHIATFSTANITINVTDGTP